MNGPKEKNHQEAGRDEKRSAFSFAGLKGRLPARPRVRREFLAIAAYDQAVVTPAFILQIGPKHQEEGTAVFGYTASRKVGNSVCRSKAKRRLREIVRLVLAEKLPQDRDYVLIARRGALTRPLERMAKDALWAAREAAKRCTNL